MPFTAAHPVRKFPFTKLLVPFACGIVCQWYLQFSIDAILITALVIGLLIMIFSILPVARRFDLDRLQTILLMLLMVCAGAIITYTKDIRHQSAWFANSLPQHEKILVTLQEPLVEKANSFKALASVNAVAQNNEWHSTTGNILLYFKKDSTAPQLQYGSQLVIQKPLQEISNSGNPGAFNYKRWCIFQSITHQVFLKQNEYILLKGTNTNWLQQQLYNIRDWTINSLQENIPGEQEQAVAEALLIGYRNDLDKDLVQAYSNTGVVHIIAISGLHLGMIYTAMVWLLSFFKRFRFMQVLQPFIILFVIWMFTLVAGAAPSIFRAAVMFTFILGSKIINRKWNMYNTLAASAFCMMVMNPFVLWDVGFLLSYAAVLGIVAFMKPVNNWFYFKNKSLQKIWGLASVTISAQVFTVPIVVFYFHQFPNLFLITNFIAVPLSFIILFGEIIVLILTPIKILASFLGMITGYLITSLNWFIQHLNKLPVSVWGGLQINVVQTWLLFGCLLAACLWLAQKSAKAFLFSISCLAALVVSISLEKIESSERRQLIVYNVPKLSATDIIDGSNYSFIGDSALLEDSFLRNFHVKPSRVQRHLAVQPENYFTASENFILKAGTTKILFLKNALPRNSSEKMAVDIIVLSGNPKVYISQLQEQFIFHEIVFDSSNPLWKIEKWKKDCENLHLRFHAVPAQGAYVKNL